MGDGGEFEIIERFTRGERSRPQRWADAVTAWMLASGEVLDGYPDEEVVTEEMLDDDRASMEIRLSPIFDGQAHP